METGAFIGRYRNSGLCNYNPGIAGAYSPDQNHIGGLRGLDLGCKYNSMWARITLDLQVDSCIYAKLMKKF